MMSRISKIGKIRTAQVGGRITCTVLLTLLFLLFSSGITNALSAEQQALFQENINYFNTDGSSCTTSGSDGTTVDSSPTSSQGSLSSLTGDAKISGTFLLGFDVSTPKSTIESVFTQYKPAGLFILGNGASSAGFDKSFFSQLAQDAGHHIVVASDEEGGSIERFSYDFNFPSAGQMGTMSDSDVQNIGQQVGQAMAANGLNTDLAPVLDVSTVSDNEDAGTSERAFGHNSATVTEKAGAFAAGLQSAGINPTYKHFPGLGSLPSQDTDSESVTYPSLSALEASDLKPYESLSNQNGAAVMMDNAHVDGLTEPGNVASTSPAAVQLLRNKYSFTGLIMTDDLTAAGMPGGAAAVSQNVANALAAGVNMPLFTYNGNSQIDAAISDTKAASVDTSQDLQHIDDFLDSTTPTSVDSTTLGTSSCCTSTASTPLTGNTPSEQVWNFFNSKGLNNTTVAAIMGNLQNESASTFNPTIVYGGSFSDTPSSTVAWGLAQWDPGSKITQIQQQAEQADADGVSGSVDDLAVQLSIIWWEASTNNSPSGGWDFSTFKDISDLDQATTYWEDHFEGATGQGDSTRQSYANAWLSYAGGTGSLPTPGVSSDGGGSSGDTPTTVADSPSTGDGCGDNTTTSTTAASTTGLTNPFPDGWTPGRLDMGYDGTFTKEIVSPCDGNMVYVNPDSDHGSLGGWEGAFIAVKCSTALQGLQSSIFYFAEGVQPTVNQGDAVTAGQQIAVPGWTGYDEGPGGIEWGLADPNNPDTLTLAESGINSMSGTEPACEGASRTMVLDFSQWVQTNLQVAAPATTDHAGCA